MHSVYYNHSSNLYKGNIQSIQISFLLFRFVLSDLRSPGEIVFSSGWNPCSSATQLVVTLTPSGEMCECCPAAEPAPERPLELLEGLPTAETEVPSSVSKAYLKEPSGLG